MKRIHMTALAAVLPIVLMGASECSTPDGNAQHAKNEQAVKAQQAADSIAFTDNAEIENIKHRLELTSNPGLLGFIVLLNESGTPVLYEGVKGKITSGTKRLTKPYGWVKRDCGQASCDKDVQAPSDEGTYGASDPYVYYTNVSGAYRQWNGKYLYSDKPIRLTVEPLIVGIEPAKK